MRSGREADRVITLYSDMVRRIRVLHSKSYADTKDIFQIVLSKYILYSGSSENSEYERVWIVRVTINACKDYLKNFFRSHTVPLEGITEVAGRMPREHNEVLGVVLSLPRRYKDAVYLFYYEGYTAAEISEILGRNVDTVYMLLARAKVILREMLGGDDFEQSAETYV